jgi:hypothetical protein
VDAVHEEVVRWSAKLSTRKRGRLLIDVVSVQINVYALEAIHTWKWSLGSYPPFSTCELSNPIRVDVSPLGSSFLTL